MDDVQSNVRLTLCKIEGYKSIRDQNCIRFPKGMPLVLVGENNSGKSNIISALIIRRTLAGDKRTRRP